MEFLMAVLGYGLNIGDLRVWSDRKLLVVVSGE